MSFKELSRGALWRIIIKKELAYFYPQLVEPGNREPSVLRADCKELNSPFLASADPSVLSHPPLQPSGLPPPHSLLSAPTPPTLYLLREAGRLSNC